MLVDGINEHNPLTIFFWKRCYRSSHIIKIRKFGLSAKQNKRAWELVLSGKGLKKWHLNWRKYTWSEKKNRTANTRASLDTLCRPCHEKADRCFILNVSNRSHWISRWQIDVNVFSIIWNPLWCLIYFGLQGCFDHRREWKKYS